MRLPRRRRVAVTTAIPALIAVLFAATPSHAQGPNARTTLQGYDGLILLDTMAVTRPITGNRDSIYVALNTVFKELGIPVEENGGTGVMLSNLKAEVSRRLGKVPLSRYFDCGQGFSGKNADFYRMTLAMVAWVEPQNGDPKSLKVAVLASGRDPTRKRSEFARCGSSGVLEEEIWKRVTELAGAK